MSAHHRFLAVACLVACKSTEAPSPSTKTEATATAKATATAAPATSASASLPADFPSRGGAKLDGTLVGKPFSVAKAILRTSPEGATLDLYAWSEGGACEPQFAPKPEQLYVSVSMPAASATGGAILHAREAGVFVTYKKPTLGAGPDVTATIALDDVGAARASGRLSLAAADGTRVAGSFDATVCRSPQTAAVGTTSLLGIAWGTASPTASLPSAPVTTLLLGKTAAPAAIESIDWDDGSLAQHELHFFMTRPAQSCAFDQMSAGVKIGFPAAFRKGLEVNAKVTTTTTRGSPFAVVLWEQPGNVIGIEGSGFVRAIIDDATANELRGRIVAWFDDPSKSMIAGAFAAKRCHVKP